MVSIICVNYKTKDYLEKMLESLFLFTKECDFEVIVVENYSGDDLQELAQKFSIKLIENDTNLGFAGGCNLAIQRARGDYFLLINPDIIFTENAICEIEKEMNSNTQIGVGGVSLKNLDGTQQDCIWRFPKPLDQLLLLLKIPHLFPSIAPISKWLMKDFDYSKDSDVDQVMGAFFCMRRSVYEELNGLDDGYFIWYEEVDFCKRVSDAGFKTHYFSDISAKHKKGSSFLSVPTIKKQKILRQSIRRYMKKHHGFEVYIFFLLLNPIFVLIALVSGLIKPKAS